MKAIKNLLGGLAGAIALNILHETVKRFDHDAPRIDLVGEEGLNKVITAAGAEPLHGDGLYAATLAGDIASNALYFSLIGKGGRRFLPIRGLVYGAAAGIGALKLTEPLGLHDAPITKTYKTRRLTIAYYAFGGLVAGLAMKSFRKSF